MHRCVSVGANCGRIPGGKLIALTGLTSRSKAAGLPALDVPQTDSVVEAKGRKGLPDRTREEMDGDCVKHPKLAGGVHTDCKGTAREEL